MLQNIRDNSSGIIAKIIVGLIAVTFIITGVNFFDTSDGDTVIASVSGIEITQRRFSTKLEQERRQLLNVLGDPTAINEDLLRKSVLNSLIEEASTHYYAEMLSFGVAEQLIDQVIRGIPQFQTDGRFDATAFDRAIGPMGMSRLGFREELRRNLTSYQVKSAVDNSVLIIPSELARLNSLQNQTRSGVISIIDSNEFSKAILVSDEAIQSFYEAGSPNFYTEKSVAIDYISLSAEHFRDQVIISDADLSSAYEAETQAASQDIERRARHILIANGDGASQKVSDLKRQLDSGVDFAEVAKANSDDIASREVGGDLGFAPKGTFGSEFEDALDRLEFNIVSAPIKTQFGYHLIELLETRVREIDSFSIRGPQLLKELTNRSATSLLSDSLEEFSNLAFSGTLEELETAYNIKVLSTKLFNRQINQGIFESKSVLNRALESDLIDGKLNADVFEVEPGIWMTFRVREYEPRRLQPLAEVRDDIIISIKTLKSLERADETARKIEAHWKKNLSGVPSSLDSVEVISFNSISRNDNADDNVSPEGLRVVFAASAPSIGKPSTLVSSVDTTRIAVVRVDQMELGKVDIEGPSQLIDAISQMRTTQEGSEFWNVVKSRVEVVKP